MSGKGSGSIQWPFPGGDAEFRDSGFGVRPTNYHTTTLKT
jgi:hypothetical protein